jgi:hypothetical protein
MMTLAEVCALSDFIRINLGATGFYAQSMHNKGVTAIFSHDWEASPLD